jgi:hypothetical protein
MSVYKLLLTVYQLTFHLAKVLKENRICICGGVVSKGKAIYSNLNAGCIMAPLSVGYRMLLNTVCCSVYQMFYILCTF